MKFFCCQVLGKIIYNFSAKVQIFNEKCFTNDVEFSTKIHFARENSNSKIICGVCRGILESQRKAL